MNGISSAIQTTPSPTGTTVFPQANKNGYINGSFAPPKMSATISGQVKLISAGELSMDTGNNRYDHGANDLIDERLPFPDLTGARFAECREHFPTDFDLYARHNEFHFKVWRLTSGRASETHGFTSGYPCLRPRLTFGSREDRTEFEAWWSRYRSFYDGDTDDMVPRLKMRQQVTLTPMERRDGLKDGEPDIVELWAWVIENCVSRVWFTMGMVMFEDDNEAILYRYRWE